MGKVKKSKAGDHKKALTAHQSHKKGCVTKCVGEFRDHPHAYRRNGYYDTRGNAQKRSFYVPDPKRVVELGLVKERQLGLKEKKFVTPENPALVPGAWDFEGDKNFKTANAPYVHNYHHIVPWEVLNQSFSAEQLRALQESGYNLNQGINLIILPCFERVATLLRLYSHPNNHPKYNSELITQVNRLKAELAGDEDEHPGEDIFDDVKSSLESWEEKEWFEIAEGGRDKKGAHVDEHVPSPMASALAAATS